MSQDQAPVGTELPAEDAPNDTASGAANDVPNPEEPSEARQPLNVTIEDIGPARKRLRIEIPTERIEKSILSTYDRLQEDSVLPGFRKGRAPRRLLERRFGDSIRKDVRGQLLSECYSQAIDENDLDVIGEPDIQEADKIELPQDGALTFDCEVEVAPEVDVPDLEGVSIIKPPAEVSDEQVQQELDRYCERFGEAEAVKSGGVQKGDYLQVDVKILAGENAGDDAEVISSHNNIYVHVPDREDDTRGHVAGIIIDDLGERVAGRNIGESVEVSVTGPKGHENEKIRDQPITIRIAINQAQRVTPAPPEALPEILGVGSVDDLKRQLHDALESRQQREQTVAMQRQVCDHLLEKITLDLPEGVTGRQAERLLRRERMTLAYRGMTPEDIDQRIAELRDASMEQAQRQLKLFFILDKAAREMDIEVSESELNGRIATMAMQHGRRPEKLRQQMQRSGELEGLYITVREQKTLDRLLEKCTITEGELPTEDADEKKPAAKKKSGRKKSGKKKAAKKKAAKEPQDKSE